MNPEIQTQLIPATPETIANAADSLRRGELVAFPTETVYGLGAFALDTTAVAKIYTAKGRPSVNPLIVHVSTRSEIVPLVTEWSDAAEKLASAFWPGPLTLILPKSSRVPDLVTAGGATVAIRIPRHPVALALLEAARVPISAPSANRSGEISPTTADHVQRSLSGRIEWILDGGPCPGGLESTVVDVSVDPPRLLRPGLIRVDQLEAIVGSIRIGSASIPDGGFPSPGMLARHYAPRTPLALVESLREVENQPSDRTAVYELDSNPEVAAARLYADLHQLDAAGWDRIVVVLPPRTETWRAIRDRLQRAATPASLAQENETTHPK